MLVGEVEVVGEAKGSWGGGRGEGVLKSLSPHPAGMVVVPLSQPVFFSLASSFPPPTCFLLPFLEPLSEAVSQLQVSSLEPGTPCTDNGPLFL